MTIRNNTQMNMLRNAVQECQGFITLIDTENGKEYDLKNQACMAEAEKRLYNVNSDSMELFASRREDTTILMKVLLDLNSAA